MRIARFIPLQLRTNLLGNTTDEILTPSIDPSAQAHGLFFVTTEKTR